MLGSKKVFVLRQGLYVAQVGLKLWTSGISVFTSPVLGYRLVQPHLTYGVLGSQSTTSYRLQALTMSLASQKCVCVYACGMCMCVTELQSQPQRIGRGRSERLIDVCIHFWICVEIRGQHVVFTFSPVFLLRQSPTELRTPLWLLLSTGILSPPLKH